MPDHTVTRESIQARLDDRFQKAAIAATVERRGSAGPRPDSEALDWIPCGDDGTATAGDGVYLVRPVRTGFIATELIDGIETISPIMPEALCREWCEARWRDREMARTKEHTALPMYTNESPL